MRRILPSSVGLFLLYTPLKPGRPSWPRRISEIPKENIMPTGTVKFFNTQKGFGFIAPEGGGNDAFVHISAVERAGMNSLVQDQRVSYELETDNRGKTSAVNLQNA
jgi:CspA family cold shock protein